MAGLSDMVGALACCVHRGCVMCKKIMELLGKKALLMFVLFGSCWSRFVCSVARYAEFFVFVLKTT